jgi:GAF domain-containing protein/HAMP domain-containing protein
MNKTISPTTFLNRLLQRTGGYYIIAVLAMAQLIVTPLGIGLAALILFLNAEFPAPDLMKLALFTGALMLIRNVILLVGAHFSNRPLVSRLGNWKHGQELTTGSTEEQAAWKQVNLLSWRYIAVAFTSLMVFVLIPTLLFARQVISASQDQVTYTLIAGIVAGISLALLEVLLIEQMLLPARNILLPGNYDAQMKGILGFRLLGKFIIVVVAIIFVSALLIAPIGYHQTIKVLYEEIGSLKVLTDLQIQSVIVAGFAVLVGLGLSFLLARSISNPVGQMINVFQKVEGGDLGQRVDVTSSDEVGQLAVHFNHMADRLEELQTSLERKVNQRTEQLRATIEVGQVASSILDPTILISKVVNLITERFGYYYAAIFLADASGRWAELKDATGEAGTTLKAQGHRLEIGGKSMVGTAITKQEARIALDVGSEPVRFNNPLLPQTRSEIALPLTVGNRVVGALDVQSTQEAAFDQENIDTLQGMANQVAIALENARLFQETQRNIEELRTTQRLYITDAWSGIIRDQGNLEFSSGSSGEQSSDGLTVEVPIALRDQIIGSLTMQAETELTAEERNLIESVATQAALALENARLLEASQQLALRERLVAEITGKIWASPNTDIILQTAIKELGRALRADEATIELKVK